MKLAIFGASGRTGQLLLLQALARGHDVTAIVRDPAAFEVRYDRLTIVAGDALKPESFDDALIGQDAVISVLGVTGFFNSLQPMTFYEESARAIMRQMATHDIRRLILVSSVGVLHDPTTPLWYRTIVQPLLRHKYADMKRMEKAAADSDLDWTIVRPGQLVDGALTQTYRIGRDGHLPNVTGVARIDLADFLAGQAEDRSLTRRAVAISY